MSSMQYVSAKAHVITKSETGRGLAKKVVEVFSSEGDGIDWHEATAEDGEGYTDAIVKYNEEGIGLMESIDEVLEEVAALGDGSYGLMVVESDWGVEGFDCYGDVELVEEGLGHVVVEVLAGVDDVLGHAAPAELVGHDRGLDELRSCPNHGNNFHLLLPTSIKSSILKTILRIGRQVFHN